MKNEYILKSRIKQAVESYVKQKSFSPSVADEIMQAIDMLPIDIGNQVRVNAMKQAFKELNEKYISLAKREKQHSAECYDMEDDADGYALLAKAEAYEHAAYLMEDKLKNMYLNIHNKEADCVE